MDLGDDDDFLENESKGSVRMSTKQVFDMLIHPHNELDAFVYKTTS